MGAGRSDDAVNELMGAVDGWASLTDRLMRNEEWDLCFVVFTSSDTAQHFFWSGEGRRVVERVYELQDEATARLVATARGHDPDVNVMVLADHGGAANTRGPEMMPVWLEDRGFMTRTKPSSASRALSSGFGLLDRSLTRGQKQALARVFPRLRERAQSEARLAGIDWSRTRAYSDGVRDEILLNVAGRDPQGTVPPSDLTSFVRELKEAVAGIRELGTGRPVVSSVTHRDDAYWGQFVDRAPDLTLRWLLDEDRAFGGFECRTPQANERMRRIAARPPFQSGGHHPEGILVAKGPNCGPGDVKGGLSDVAPTILAMLGVPVPGDLDGRPLEFLRGVDVQAADAPADGARVAADPTSGYTPEEEDAVRRRLEDLGYL
jgi:predicted AlkP superfamily phosphohydrolase/phosphomutase